MSEKKRAGHVAKIMNDRQLIVTLGKEDGIEVGDYVGILDPTTEQISDPVEGGSRGSIVYFKSTLRITHVSEGLSVAATYKTRSVNRGGLMGPGISNILAPPKWEEEIERFNGELSATHELGTISVGDEVYFLSKEVADNGFYLEPPMAE